MHLVKQLALLRGTSQLPAAEPDHEQRHCTGQYQQTNSSFCPCKATYNHVIARRVTTMIIKFFLLLLLAMVLISLFRALFQLVRGQTHLPASHYLGRRVIFSVLLVALLLLAMLSGLLTINPSPF